MAHNLPLYRITLNALLKGVGARLGTVAQQ
jgi:hypothetical protein